MKFKTLLTLFSAITAFSSTTLAQECLDFAVISDIHIMSPSLLKADSKDFEQYIQHDRKLLREGPLLVKTAIQKILQQPQRPQIVLIPGALTKDGEKTSHQLLADTLLKPLRQSNIAVYVIPGNHDVNNPHAVCFEKDTTYRTTTISDQEFAEIYKDYGYGTALARDPNSLSYVVQLNDTLRLIAIDACRYQDNDFERNICVTGGRIQPQTFTFIKQQADVARKEHCRLIAMMHHGLVRHWKWQDKIMSDYLVKDWKHYAKVFARLGIHTVFTGHFHAQDISSHGKGRRQVYDIETGSTVSYPLPIRRIRLTDGKMDIRTELIGKCSLLPDASQFELEAIHYAQSGVSTLIEEMLPEKIPSVVRVLVSETVAEAYLAHLAGDESMTESYNEILRKACKQLRPYSWKYAFALKRIGRYLITDTYPKDNQITLPF